MTNDDLEKYLSDENEEWGIEDLIRKYSHPGDDELIRRALEAVLVDRNMNLGYLMRRLDIGYGRAVKLLEELNSREIGFDTGEEFPDDQDRAAIAPLVNKYLLPGDDELIRKALEVAFLDRKMSTSYLQRRLKIDYNRAAEIVEVLEARHVVGPLSGSGNKREILIFDDAQPVDSASFRQYHRNITLEDLERIAREVRPKTVEDLLNDYQKSKNASSGEDGPQSVADLFK